MNRSPKKFVFFIIILFLHTCMFPVCCFRQRTCAAQSHMNRAPNETQAHPCVGFLVEYFSGVSLFYIVVIVLCWISLPLPLFPFSI